MKTVGAIKNIMHIPPIVYKKLMNKIIHYITDFNPSSHLSGELVLIFRDKTLSPYT